MKDVLKAYGGPNAVPKLRAMRGTGTVACWLEKGDYIAAAIDLLRDHNDNDYATVVAIIAKDQEGTKKNGFAWCFGYIEIEVEGILICSFYSVFQFMLSFSLIT